MRPSAFTRAVINNRAREKIPTIDARKGKITLEEGCKIGANSVIFPNVRIRKNATIGANSLVNCDIPENEVWVGSPAKKLR